MNNQCFADENISLNISENLSEQLCPKVFGDFRRFSEIFRDSLTYSGIMQIQGISEKIRVIC